jgi:hypothetical protein
MAETQDSTSPRLTQFFQDAVATLETPSDFDLPTNLKVTQAEEDKKESEPQPESNRRKSLRIAAPKTPKKEQDTVPEPGKSLRKTPRKGIPLNMVESKCEFYLLNCRYCTSRCARTTPFETKDTCKR